MLEHRFRLHGFSSSGPTKPKARLPMGQGRDMLCRRSDAPTRRFDQVATLPAMGHSAHCMANLAAPLV